MTIHQSSYSGEFEVTEADHAVVAPLGEPTEVLDSDRLDRLALLLRGIINTGGLDDALPVGFWDCFPDEGGYRQPTDEDIAAGHDPLEYVETRGYDSAFDDVFVRIPAVDGTSGVWDVEVFTRRGENNGFAASACINGEEITPEDLVRDLGALLAVFRLYVQQGKFS